VADTNVVLSGLLWLGTPGRVLEAAAKGRITLYTSPALVAELSETLPSAKLAARIQASDLTLDELLQGYLDVVILAEPQSVPRVVPDDPDDGEVVAAAIAAQAQLIVSGDRHLLDIEGIDCGIPIVPPAQALRIIARS
jgi:putative PIN family toxin of toxin-antitoxin system